MNKYLCDKYPVGYMVYLRELGSECEERGCSRKAVVELYSWDNYSIGKYCRSHGNRKLAERLELEKGCE